MSLLIEEFSDTLDAINDRLTEITEDEIQGIAGFEPLMNDINDVLNEHGLLIDYSDIESLTEDWEEPSVYEAVNVLIPIYDNSNNQTEYNLSFTYAASDNVNSYMIDAEVQYEWEAEDELGTDYLSLDDDDIQLGR